MKRNWVVFSVVGLFALAAFAEKNYDFRKRLECVHQPDLRDAALAPAADEYVLADGATVGIPAAAGEVLKGAAEDFVAYFKESMNVKAALAGPGAKASVAVALDPSLGKGVHTVKVTKDGVLVKAVDERQAAQALYHLEDLMNLRRAPFLKFGEERREALFSPRMTHSAWGMDVFPDKYLRKVAHTGMDAIIICINEEDKTCGQPKGQDVNDVIRRAKKVGLDTYLYWKDNFDLRAFVHPDDPKAAEGYAAVFGRITGRYPDAKGVIFVGESAQFPSKDPHVLPMKSYERGKEFEGDTRLMPGFYPCEDYPQWVKGVSAAIRKHNPKADFVFWTYNWGIRDDMEAPRLKMIAGLQKDVSLLVTYEMFEKFDLPNGHHTQCDDYTLAFPGPGRYFTADAKQAKASGLPLYATTCTGGRTWDHGCVPFLPVPQLWKKRWDGLVKAHDEWGLSGIMEGHHNAAEPNFVNELQKEAFTRGGIPFDRHLRMIAARDYGEEQADRIVEAFAKWSEAQTLVPPTHVNEYGMFRIGPAYPFNALGKPLFGSLGEDLDKSDFPISKDAMYGLGILRLNYADDQVRQFYEGLDYFPRLVEDEAQAKLEIESVEKAAKLYEQGLAVVRAAGNGMRGDARGWKAWRLTALGDFLMRTCRTAVNVKKAKLLEDKVLSDKTDAKAKAAARAEILKLARDEYENAKGAIPSVQCDSTLGYEPSMEYAGGEEQIRWKLRKMVETYGPSVKPMKEWTLDEIKAGVTDAGDTVTLAYPKEGLDLAVLSAAGEKVGEGRNAFSRVFAVPAAFYDFAKVLVSVDPDAKKDRRFGVRLTRYNDGTAYGGRDHAGVVDAVVDFDTAEKRKVGDNLWEVTVPIDMGAIADFVWGGDMYGTWLNNTIGPTEPKNYVNKEIGNYLDCEVLPRLVTFRHPQGDHRNSPDAKYACALTVKGVTLHKAGFAFEVVQSQKGNVFAADEKPETSIRFAPTSPGAWVLRSVVRDVEGNVLKNQSLYAAQLPQPPQPSQPPQLLALDLSQKTVGWYGLDYVVEKDGKPVMTHRASFALLPPDTRTSECGEGPYGTWTYGGGHYTLKIDESGPLCEKAGFRRILGGIDIRNGTNRIGHPYKIGPQTIIWKKGATEAEQIAHFKRQLEDNPLVRTFLIFHEDAPWGYQHAWELTDQPVPDPKDYHLAGWYNWEKGEEAVKKAFKKRTDRHAMAMERAAFLRKHFPEVKITLGNSIACTEIVAEAIRDGLPEEYADYMGLESVVRTQLPEREGDMGIQGADMMKQLAEHYGYKSWKPNAAFESDYRLDTILGLDRQAAWYVRDILLQQAWRFPDIFVGVLTDTGNTYGGSFWGTSGLCWRAPTAYPKPAYVGIATATRLLDRVTASRRIPCGDECVYVNEFARQDGMCVTAVWTSRGEAEVTLDLSHGNVAYEDFYGRPAAPLRDAGNRFSRTVRPRNPVLNASEFVTYVVSDGPAVVSAKVGARRFPGWDKVPEGAKLVTKAESLEDWQLETTTNRALEFTTGPFLPYRTLGKYDVREVVDGEMGKCLELELAQPNGKLPLIMNEYAVLKLKKPIPLEGAPATLGAWVKGNSGWGQFYWVLQDEGGGLCYSCGNRSAMADVYDYDGRFSICFTGWSYLQVPVLPESSIKDISTGSIDAFWCGAGRNGKMKLAGVAFSAMNRPLFLTERRPHDQKIRIGGIFASEFQEGK